MSTQTGIRANAELNDFFAKCRKEDSRTKYRLIKVVIDNEELALEEAFETGDDWEKDWNRLVLPAVDPDEPSFLLYRLDEKDGETYRWLLISWSPESSSIRNKMLYASTKATLKKDFGANQIKDDVYGNVKEDISLNGYRKHELSANAQGPLTREEEEREEVKMAQVNVDISVDSKHQTMTGLAFPLVDGAMEALQSYKDEHTNYVQLSIDVKRETIRLEKEPSVSCTVAELPDRVPEEAPRYHLFKFKHTYEGDYFNSTAFIYSMPGYNCSIKERMLYSSCKNSVVEMIEGLGIEIVKKLEVDSAQELTETFLMDEFHPQQNLNRKQFERPKPPGRGGKKRITKVPQS